MLDFQKIGMAYLELLRSNPFYNISDDISMYWYDRLILIWLKGYYSPFWWAGNIDDIIGAGITLNGIRPTKT